MIKDNIEIRNYTSEVRMSEDNEGVFYGDAAKYNVPSEDMGFVEYIEPGFFDEALTVSDTRGLIDHISAKILGRKSAGTLKLDATGDGLSYEITDPKTSYSNDLAISIRRGDIKESSFGFVVKSIHRGDEINGDRWEEDENGNIKRYLVPNGCKYLVDVSPVTFPAYPDATAGKRSLEMYQEEARSKDDKKEEGFDLIREKELQILKIKATL